jgi:hypothetical protein
MVSLTRKDALFFFLKCRKDALNITVTWYIESEQRGEKKQSTCEKKRGKEERRIWGSSAC